VIAELGKAVPGCEVTIGELNLVVQNGPEQLWDWRVTGAARRASYRHEATPRSRSRARLAVTACSSAVGSSPPRLRPPAPTSGRSLPWRPTAPQDTSQLRSMVAKVHYLGSGTVSRVRPDSVRRPPSSHGVRVQGKVPCVQHLSFFGRGSRTPRPAGHPVTIGPPIEERAKPCGSRWSAHWANDLDSWGLVCSALLPGRW
jgi:hypothetical protein